ncbi:hypothetical protein CVT24_002724, partial [Panaeolus cyanescens]
QAVQNQGSSGSQAVQDSHAHTQITPNRYGIELFEQGPSSERREWDSLFARQREILDNLNLDNRGAYGQSLGQPPAPPAPPVTAPSHPVPVAPHVPPVDHVPEHVGPWPFSPAPTPAARPFSTSILTQPAGRMPDVHFPPVMPPPPVHPMPQFPHSHHGSPGYAGYGYAYQYPPFYPPPQLQAPASVTTHTSFNMSGCMSMLSSIAILKRKSSRQVVSNWLGAIMRVLYTANLAGHVICSSHDESVLRVSPGGADPVYPPALSAFPTYEERAAFQRWRQLDSAAYQIVVSRIDSQVADCLPPTVDGSLPTARQVMKDILLTFSPGAFVDSQKLVNDLRALTVHGPKVEAYLLEWTKGWIQVIRDGTLWGVRDATVQFLSKLPASFAEFRLEQCRVLERVHDSDKLHLLSVIKLVGEREVASGMFNASTRPSGARSSAPASTAPSITCENCGIPGHTQDLCFKAGGGRAGQAPPKKVRPTAAVAHVAVGVDDGADGVLADGLADGSNEVVDGGVD